MKYQGDPVSFQEIFSFYKGTSNFVNKKRTVNIIESAEIENERQKLLCKILNKLKEMEEEK